MKNNQSPIETLKKRLEGLDKACGGLDEECYLSLAKDAIELAEAYRSVAIKLSSCCPKERCLREGAVVVEKAAKELMSNRNKSGEEKP